MQVGKMGSLDHSDGWRRAPAVEALLATRLAGRQVYGSRLLARQMSSTWSPAAPLQGLPCPCGWRGWDPRGLPDRYLLPHDPKRLFGARGLE
jgi:hypothetical protein